MKSQNCCIKKKEVQNPELATDIHRLARNVLGRQDLYMQEKYHANRILNGNYRQWKKKIDRSRTPLHAAAKLAVAGNIIDYGAHSVPADIRKQIGRLTKQGFAIDDTEDLFRAITVADSILYIGDNAGEIVFDKLFIETTGHSNVQFAVRGRAVINDATLEDAMQVGMDECCTVISNGSDAPSTLLEACSREFQDAFFNAGLIIAKGQGNFEGLMHCDHPNIYFMLMAKCGPMADMLGVRKGEMVVRKGRMNEECR